MKRCSKWIRSQSERAEILFQEYPALEKAYGESITFTQIYNEPIIDTGIALTKLGRGS